MFQFLANRKSILSLGGVALAFAIGITPVNAQNQPASGNPPPKDNSLLVPPTAQGNSAELQTTNNGQSSKDVFMQPSGQGIQGQVDQAAMNQPVLQQNANQSRPMTPPQPPTQNNQQTINAQQNVSTQSNERAQLGVYVVATNGAGVRINSVSQGTAAAAAGLQPGDIVLSMNGNTVSEPQDVIGGIQQMHPGDQVEFQIRRNNADQRIVATLQPMRESVAIESVPAIGYSESSGIPVTTYSRPLVRQYYNSPGRYYSNYPSYGYGRYGYGGPGYYGGGRYYNGGRYGGGYGGSYIGTPGLGYYSSPWGGQGVRVGSFGFGWR